MDRFSRSAVTLLTAAVALAGCGSSSKDDEKGSGKTDPAKLGATFTKATGVRLVRRDSEPWTTLSGSATGGYGAFTIYVVKEESARKSLLEAGTSKDLGDGVVLSSFGSGDDAGRLERAVTAAVKGDPNLIPAAERSCASVGIDPAQGKAGTCRLATKQVTVVDGRSELAVPVLKAKLSGVTVAAALPARNSALEPKRAKGRYVVVRYALTNSGTTPIASIRTNLVVGRNTYSESPDSYVLTDFSDAPLPVQPGASATVTSAFDIPQPAADEAVRTGQLELPAGRFEGSDSLSDDDAVGRIRLAGAPALALASPSPSSGGASSPSTPAVPAGGSATSRGRQAAAEDALKEFYSALHKGNVKFVCRRLTRAAQQRFGGASTCSTGRIVSAKAKAKAPASNVGLRFTTILTNGQTRALILVRRQNGGFTDAARLARQGNLWRVQGTRRLSSLG